MKGIGIAQTNASMFGLKHGLMFSLSLSDS